MSEVVFNEIDPTVADEVEVIQLVGMKLGEEEYAIDVLKIQEIIRTVEITIVPRSESFILGVMNLRGKVIPVVDLRIRFSLDKVDFDKTTRIIVVRFEKENIGFVVDEVTQVIRINKQMVEPTPPLVGAVGQEYILGICKYFERLIILLDIDRVVNNSTEQVESALRKRFAAGNDKKSASNYDINALNKEAKEGSEAPAENLEGVTSEEISAVSEEVTPLNEKKNLVDDNDDDDDDDEGSSLDTMLDDIQQQSTMKGEGTSFIKQSELEALLTGDNKSSAKELSIDEQIAIELAKREKETEELNSKKKGSQNQAASTDSSSKIDSTDKKASADSLSIDEQIALELAKREAETEELNRKKKGSVSENPLNQEPLSMADEVGSVVIESIDQDIPVDEDPLPESDSPVSNDKDDSKVESQSIESLASDIQTEEPISEEKIELQEEIYSESPAEDVNLVQNPVVNIAESAEQIQETPNNHKEAENTEKEEKPNNLSFTSIDELKDVAKRIIDGKQEDIDIVVKDEVSELLSLLVDIKEKIDEIQPNVATSQKDLPFVVNTLTDINNTTEKAAINLLSNAQKMSSFYTDLTSNVDKLEAIISKADKESYNTFKANLMSEVSEAGQLGTDILLNLEFQDITEQKLRKVIKSIEGIGARLGSIVGFMKTSEEDKEQFKGLLTDLGFA